MTRAFFRPILISLILMRSTYSLANPICDANGDFLAQVACLDGVEVKPSSEDSQRGYKAYDATIIQPVDHRDPSQGSFKQKLVIHHVTNTAPMILQTSGYDIFGVALSEVARTFRANQIQVEHQFFASSSPSPQDWSKLDIFQSANDFHQIVLKFKSIYKGKWLNTGASKGGMTSVYHRYFFPDDLDGTLALVAPLSYSREDLRYANFLETVGGERWSKCRDDLKRLQIELLQGKTQLLASVTGDYRQLSSKSVAFEHAVYELPFAFWQYGSPLGTYGCSRIPSSQASLSDKFRFFESVNGVKAGYSDGVLAQFMPYYAQAAHQLGGPGIDLSPLASFAEHTDTFTLEKYVVSEALKDFDPTVMPQVQDWLTSESEKIMFIYGELDPWTAAKMTPGPAERDNHLFIVPGDNHSASVSRLPAAERKRATAILQKWLNVSTIEPVDMLSSSQLATEEESIVDRPSLEEIETSARRRLKL